MCLQTNAKDAKGREFKDLTGQAGNRRNANAKIKQRLNGAYRDVRELIKKRFIVESVSKEKDLSGLQNNANVYRYRLTDRNIEAEIRRILENWFQTGNEEMPRRWFLSSNLQTAFNLGVAKSSDRIQLLGPQAGVGVESLTPLQTERLLLSDPFKAHLSKIYNRVFEQMKGFTGDVAVDLARTLGDSAAAGESRRELIKRVRDRFGVSESRSKRIVRTEINQAYRSARRETAIEARDRLKIDMVQQWISALLIDTRKTHGVQPAGRHLGFYTMENTAEFYSRDGNAINCYCIQQEVIVMPDGKIIGART